MSNQLAFDMNDQGKFSLTQVEAYAVSYPIGQMSGRELIKKAAKDKNLGLNLPCFWEGMKQSEKFGDPNSEMLTGNMASFDSCIKFLQNVSGIYDDVESIKGKNIPQTLYAVSGLYYFIADKIQKNFGDKLAENELRVGKPGDAITVKQIYEAAKELCGSDTYRMYFTDKTLRENINLCLDAGNFFALMKAYGFSDTQKLVPMKKFNGVKAGWHIGAALKILNY